MKKILVLVLAMVMCLVFATGAFAVVERPYLKENVHDLRDLAQNAVIILEMELDVKNAAYADWTILKEQVIEDLSQGKKNFDSSYTFAEIIVNHQDCGRDIECILDAIADIKLLAAGKLSYSVSLDFLNEKLPANMNNVQKQYFYVRQLLEKMYQQGKLSITNAQQAYEGKPVEFGDSDDYYLGFNSVLRRVEEMKAYYYASSVLFKAEKNKSGFEYRFYN